MFFVFYDISMFCMCKMWNDRNNENALRFSESRRFQMCSFCSLCNVPVFKMTSTPKMHTIPAVNESLRAAKAQDSSNVPLCTRKR